MRFRPFLAVLLLLVLSSSFVAATVAAYPTGVTFPAQAIGTSGPVQNVTVYNFGPKAITVTKATPSLTVYTVVSGTLPFTIQPNQNETFQVQFTPTSAKTFSGKLTFTITGASAQTVNLTGLGTNPKAIPTLSTTAMTFEDQALGANGPSQTLTITNQGTVAVSLSNLVITAPFTQKGWTAATSIQPGKSFSVQISYVPTEVGTQAGTILLSYNVAPPAGVSLWGTSESATALGVTSYPILPAGTQGALYQANLTAVGGLPPYTWSLSGTTLPSGLTLSSAGVVSGTIGSTVTTGSYSVTVSVSDSSSPPAIATLLGTVSVNKPTGANCNNTSFNASDGSGALVPIMDLGTNVYLGAESGGLYANGVNLDDLAHDAYGQGLAAAIQPLDSNGNPDPNGKYVLLGIGLSVTQQSLDQVVPMAMADPARNPNLVFVNGATGGATATDLLAQPQLWQAMINDYLPNAGVTQNQVVAVWFMDVDGGISGTFPSDMTLLQSQMETVSQTMLTYFPNLKIAYDSSIYYTGYSNGVKTLSNEPWTYESGFAVKNMIQDQLNGNSNLNFDPTKGTVLAPWMAWGPYLWANGLIPRSDGLVWACNDIQNDGTHPAAGAKVKVAQQLLNFLKTDDTAAPWFLAPAASAKH